MAGSVIHMGSIVMFTSTDFQELIDRFRQEATRLQFVEVFNTQSNSPMVVNCDHITFIREEEPGEREQMARAMQAQASGFQVPRIS